MTPLERATREAYARKVIEADNNWPPFDEAPFAWRQRTEDEVHRVITDLFEGDDVARFLHSQSFAKQAPWESLTPAMRAGFLEEQRQLLILLSGDGS